MRPFALGNKSQCRVPNVRTTFTGVTGYREEWAFGTDERKTKVCRRTVSRATQSLNETGTSSGQLWRRRTGY